MPVRAGRAAILGMGQISRKHPNSTFFANKMATLGGRAQHRWRWILGSFNLPIPIGRRSRFKACLERPMLKLTFSPCC